MADELSAPLGRRSDKRKKAEKAERAPGLRRNLPLARSAFAILVIIALGIAARLFLVDDPEGGRPSAEVAINSTQNANTLANDVADAGLGTDTTETPVEGGPSFITLGDDLPEGDPMIKAGLAPDEAGLFPDLMEETQAGAVPRIGADGKRPFDAYARSSVTPATAEGRPMIAVVVTGLGLNEAGTLDAIGKLPDDITLAFAPYGKSLDTTVAAARAQGHELFLEIPLEPFDYPDNDPGPETLLTGDTPRANIDKLMWLMARFGGYVGLMNHMGARFTASAADFNPMMEELSARGLGYLDDGSSNRSVAPQLAEVNAVPFFRADMLLDSNPARDPILTALKALESTARSKGMALGVVSALPVSIDTVAEWAAGLEEAGFVLVPASALMTSGP
jgi:polysaccharide deacetylase 2 family uncharacterized protein YibQ